jgi:hypothetical protein
MVEYQWKREAGSTSSSANLLTTNVTESKPDLSDEKPAINLQTCGTSEEMKRLQAI